MNTPLNRIDRLVLACVVILTGLSAPVRAQEVLIVDEFFPGVNNRFATISLHIGAEVQQVRAVYVIFERSGYGIPVFESAAWRQYMASRSMALMMIEDYNISNGPLPDAGLGQTILNSLSDFAARPGIDRPSLAAAPLFTWGLSRSALWATNMAAFAPERCAGFIVFRMLDTTDLAITTHPTTDIQRVRTIPALILGGERDGVIPLGAQQAYNQLRRGRALDAPWTGGIERGQGHTGDALETAIIWPWIDAMLVHRVPPTPGPLIPLNDDAGFFGALGQFINTPPTPTISSPFIIAPTACFPEDSANTSWTPDLALALAWQEHFRPGSGPRVLECGITCPEDVDDSGTIDADDVFEFLAIWFAATPGSPCTSTALGCPGDWNIDGTVDGDDVFAYLGSWFATGPGSTCP